MAEIFNWKTCVRYTFLVILLSNLDHFKNR